MLTQPPGTKPAAASPQTELRIDVAFPVSGLSIPLDHGYKLFSALCKHVDVLHAAPWLAIHPLRGTRVSPGTLALAPETCLRLRVPPGYLSMLLPLSQQLLQVNGHSLRLGAPQLQIVLPAPALAARLVIIKGYMEEASFREALVRQLESMEVRARVEIGLRRITQIGNHRVVGFAVRLSGLSEDASLLIQYRGVGGRQHMGCGVFTPRPFRERQ